VTSSTGRGGGAIASAARRRPHRRCFSRCDISRRVPRRRSADGHAGSRLVHDGACVHDLDRNGAPKNITETVTEPGKTKAVPVQRNGHTVVVRGTGETRTVRGPVRNSVVTDRRTDTVVRTETADHSTTVTTPGGTATVTTEVTQPQRTVTETTTDRVTVTDQVTVTTTLTDTVTVTVTPPP